MSRARFIAAVLAVGFAAGCIAALLGDRAPARPVAPVGGPSQVGVPRAPAPPVGPVTIAARAKDPDRTADWAVRRFRTRSRGATFACVQLGRVDGGRFGWIAPRQPFRRGRFDQADLPTNCGETFLRGLPQLQVTTLTTDAASGLTEPDRTIVWGVLPPGTAGARLADGTRLEAADHRVVLAVMRGRPLGEPRLAGTLRARGGAIRPFAWPRPDDDPAVMGNGRQRPAKHPGGSAVKRRARVAVRAPDPAGGAAWGILTAPSTRGRTCRTGPARVVGDRLAFIDPRLGLATAYPFTRWDCSNRRAPTAAHPLRMDVLHSSVPEEDPTASVQLRRLNDRTVLYGRATADVTAVTITTSRDIRTLVPDRRYHLVLAVYDGGFPGERLKFTATLRHGRRVTLLQASGA